MVVRDIQPPCLSVENHSSVPWALSANSSSTENSSPCIVDLEILLRVIFKYYCLSIMKSSNTYRATSFSLTCACISSLICWRMFIRRIADSRKLISSSVWGIYSSTFAGLPFSSTATIITIQCVVKTFSSFLGPVHQWQYAWMRFRYKSPCQWLQPGCQHE